MGGVAKMTSEPPKPHFYDSSLAKPVTSIENQRFAWEGIEKNYLRMRNLLFSSKINVSHGRGRKK